jgi:hypothetical protein
MELFTVIGKLKKFFFQRGCIDIGAWITAAVKNTDAPLSMRV